MSASPSPENLADVLRQLVALGHEEAEGGEQIGPESKKHPDSNSAANVVQGDPPAQRADAGKILDA